MIKTAAILIASAGLLMLGACADDHPRETTTTTTESTTVTPVTPATTTTETVSPAY